MPILVGDDTTQPMIKNIRPPGMLLGVETVTFGDITIGVVQPNGANLHVGSLTGWDNMAPVTGGVTQRAADDGAWLTPSYYAARPIGVGANIDTDSWENTTALLELLEAQIPGKVLTEMLVFDGTRSLSAMVRREGTPVVTRGGTRANLSVGLVAPDFRRYSPVAETASTNLPTTAGGLSLPISLPISLGATVSTGRMTVLNEGNEDTSPTFTVIGPCPPCTITHLGTGRQMQVPDAVPAGRVLVIDVDKHTALLDGTASRVVTGTWFDLPPGESVIAFAGGPYDPAAQLQVAWRSAWR